MERRSFLEAITHIFVGFTLGEFASSVLPLAAFGENKVKGKVLLCYDIGKKGSSQLVIYDWDNNEHQDFTLPLSLPHSVIRDKENQNLFYSFEVFGSCIRLDTQSGEIVKLSHQNSHEMFGGHGVLTQSGEHLICSQIDQKLSRGVVNLRKSKDLSLIVQFPPECDQSHHIVLLPGTDIVVCGNGSLRQDGRGGAITFFDHKKRKVLRRFEVDYPIIHLLPLSESEVVGITYFQTKTKKDSEQNVAYSNDSMKNVSAFTHGSETGPAPLYHAKLDGDCQEFWNSKEKDDFRFGFGLAKIAKSHRFISGHKDSNKVMLWENFEIKKSVDIDSPTNIISSLDGTEIIVATNGKAVIYSADELKKRKELTIPFPLLSISSY